MAELSAFNLSSKVVAAVASPAIKKAYEKGLSIWEAEDELAKLKETIGTIHAVLLDAEKKLVEAERKQQDSDGLKGWIKRLKGVLYDADDLFDEVATDDLLKQQLKKKGMKRFLQKKGWVSCFELNPIIFRNSIAKKVQAIRKSLDGIYVDMAPFQFEICRQEGPISEREQDPGCLIDTKNLIGRDEDKRTILEMLVKESDNVAEVIAIFGIGGMGKTALANLIYGDDEIKDTFKKRWFACISDISDDEKVIGKIFQAMSEENSGSFTTVRQQQQKIRDWIAGQKFLLVLDDVWDDNRASWLGRKSLFEGGAKGSKIIVTTRFPLVVEAVGAVETHNLKGLSDSDSWDLFKWVAFREGDENDPTRIDLARKVMKKCRNVPLAIRSVGGLLFEKHTIQEWKLVKDQELSDLGDQDPTMSVLKLSYHHLPPNLKHCFAYCSLFPKDFVFFVPRLKSLWISQGYIKPDPACHSGFMHLFRRGFFQEPITADDGVIYACKMHDLIHDLALHVAGNESNMLTIESSSASTCVRHVSIDDRIDKTWVIPTHLHNSNKLRSLSFLGYGEICSSALDQLCVDCKLLRSLDLRMLRIENVPSSIGEMKHLRYLDLSFGFFKSLPDSMTNLLNLITLNLICCRSLKALPDNFRELINLMELNIHGCDQLKHMPAGLGELTCLQNLTNFHVGKAASSKSGLDELARMELRGCLSIGFQDDWDGDECNWQLPQSLEKLEIRNYPGKRIPDWGMYGRTNNLAVISFIGTNVINLSPLRCLANLSRLYLHGLSELEFMEEESQSSCMAVEGSSFFPRLKYLLLVNLPKLKGWWRKPATSTPSFPLLHELQITCCPELKSFPLCPRLQELTIKDTRGNEVLEQVLFDPASTIPPSSSSPPSSCFQEMLASPHLRTLEINKCCRLKMLHVAAPQLRHLKICFCSGLEKVHIAKPNALEVLEIGKSCEETLELWEEDERSVDWDSLSNLSILRVSPVPPPEKLPECLRCRQARGQLQISPCTLELPPPTYLERENRWTLSSEINYFNYCDFYFSLCYFDRNHEEYF